MKLIDYATVLVEAGFKVWHARGHREGYLVYQDPENGCWGLFMESEHEGWDHHMPLKPSREFGSSMWHLPEDEDRWTVEAARKTAQPTNYNHLVGTQKNHREPWMSASAVTLHEEAFPALAALQDTEEDDHA